MDSKAAELSLVERAIAMESAYYYYGAYVTANSGAVAVDAEGAGTGATEAGTEVKAEGTGTNAETGTVGMEAIETEVVENGGAEIEGVGATEMTELVELEDSDEEETPKGIQIQQDMLTII